MSKKIFRSIIAVAFVVLIASLVITNSFLYGYFNSNQKSRLKEELALASVGVEQAGTDYFNNFHSSLFRFTLISKNGTVLYDSEANTAEMENHLNRKEIQEALQTGSGNSARYSSTLTERTFYEAVQLSNGNILRIATTQVTVGALVLSMAPAICAIILFSLVIAIILSQKMAQSIVKPLENLDLENPEQNNTYEELTPILTKLNRQHKQIHRQLQKLQQKNEEFQQITAAMQEGLVLLDKNGCVLSLNNAAKALLQANETAVGQDFLLLDRNPLITRGVQTALQGTHSECKIQKNGRKFQFIFSPTGSKERIFGAVILCIDITEAALAELSRKEFTANVSHELKTPLQSIIGSAELLANGLVQPEDRNRFAQNIKNEAERLVTLINDIIQLSQLDEEKAFPKETVNLYAVAQEAVSVLSPAAQKKQVTLSLLGEPCTLEGVRSYLYEIVYNLCDNAIRYNRTGGTVEVALNQTDNCIQLKVKDTGCGIPPKHQSRIFERFYRVDKSHSKETGGTGLGLSIVKHAVTYHQGSIQLESAVDKGTTVTVTFPKNKQA